MTPFTFDPTAVYNAYRDAIAPALQVQQEGLKALENLGRYQYAVAGDYLEWSLAQAKASLSASNPAELAATQTALATQFGDRFKSRVQEFVGLATSTQTSFNQLFGETAAKAAESMRKAA